MADGYLEGIMNRQMPAMTSHQDVAGLLLRLRGRVHDAPMDHEHMMDEAADLLGAQAKALSEAEEESARLLTEQRRSLCAEHDKDIAELKRVRAVAKEMIETAEARARAAEALLAEATGILQFYAEPFEYIKKHGLEEHAPDFYDELNTGERAQDFLRAHAAKEKT